MKMNEGVEWGLHSCLNLSWVTPGTSATATKLASFFQLPAAYLNKQLQALSRARILTSTSGPKGGFRLARDPAKISAMEVIAAIEGPEEAFRCAHILREAPFGDPTQNYQQACVISQVMHSAELTWRKELAGQSIADIAEKVEENYPGTATRVSQWFAS